MNLDPAYSELSPSAQACVARLVYALHSLEARIPPSPAAPDAVRVGGSKPHRPPGDLRAAGHHNRIMREVTSAIGDGDTALGMIRDGRKVYLTWERAVRSTGHKRILGRVHAVCQGVTE